MLNLSVGYPFPLTVIAQEQLIDISEAPAGYIPVPKDKVSPKSYNGNICELCDYKKEHCSKEFPCMSYSRKDRISVVFKKIV